jgi:large subunit ribosomal protein L31
MKKGIHPNYHKIKLVLTDGETYEIGSTWGKPGDVMRTEIDRTSHPAYTDGGHKLLDRGGQLARFNKRFQGLGLKS